MMKKIVSMMLALCLLGMCLMFTGCRQTTFGVVSAALEKTQALDSMAAEMKMEMNMKMEGATMSIPVTANMKAKGLKSDAPVVSTDLSMTVLGQNVDMEVYQEGEWAYLVVGDMKYKTNVANTEEQLDYTQTVGNMLQDLPEELLSEAEMVKGDDGSVTVTVPIPDEQFARIYNDLIGELSTTVGVEAVDFKISGAVVKITVAEGYVSVYDMEFTMDMTVESVSTTTEVKASVTYENPGEEVVVTPPEGYQDFEEMDIFE